MPDYLTIFTRSFFRQFARRLWRAQEGAVAIYVAFVSVIMIGFGALVADVGRTYTLQTELQDAADASARAGGAELDQTATSITRARAAAKTALVNNVQTFASGGKNVVITDADIRFLSSLPADDDTPIPASSVTTDPLQARYIQVTPAVRAVDYLLAPVLALFYGNQGDQLAKGKATATAVAGLECVVCNFPPLMICNPAESPSNPGEPFKLYPGMMVELKQGGGTGQWTPGNFGLLDPPQGNQGTSNLVEQLASASPKGCYSARVDLRTGNAQNPVSKGINVRFDMYENPGFGGGASNNSSYKPAPNVTKGKYLSGSSYVDYGASPPLGSRAMPTHPCFATGTCSTLGPLYNDRFGPAAAPNEASQEAFWSDYWASNHSGEDFGALYSSGAIDPNGDGIVTREEVYNWENNNNAIPLGNTNGDSTIDALDLNDPSSPTGENGHPKEYTGSAAPDPKRRTMYVAVINCVQEGPLNGNSDNVPVLAFAKVFLTHPSADTADQTIYAEIVDVLEPGVDSGVLHDIVQLYR